MGKLAAFVDLFRKGSEVADPATWKNRAASIVAVTALIYAVLAIGKAYGYVFDISPEDVGGIAVGIVTAVSLLSNFTTSKKVGVLPAKPAAPVDVPAGSVGDPSSPAERDGPH